MNMEKLKVKITFRSGRTKYIESYEHYKGQFRTWVDHNFIKSDGGTYDFVAFNNILININEIETIEEIE